MQEQELFSSENVYVSTARFVAFGQTYAMSGVTSIKTVEIGPSRGGTMFLGFLGALCFLGDGLAWKALGAGMLALAAWVFAMQDSEYVILLNTASGEVKALRSGNRQYIGHVVQAL